MADETIDFSTLNGFYKDRYGKLEDRIYDFAILQRSNQATFVQKTKEDLGNYYKVAVVTRRPQGFTYNTTATAFDLNDTRSTRTKGAQVQGAIVALEEQVGVATLVRAQKSEQAFGNAFDTIVNAMDLGLKFRQEVELIYGGYGLGKTPATGTTNATADAALTGSAYEGAEVHAATNVDFTEITIDPQHWAAGIWQASEGAGLQFYNSSGTLIGTQVFDLIAYDVQNRKIVVAGTSANITTLAASINTPTVLDIFFEGQRSNSMVGLKTISRNTGTLFGLNGAINSVFKGNTRSLGSTAFNVGKWLIAMSFLQARGLMEDACMLCSPRTWANFATDASALRMLDSSYKSSEVDQGSKTIRLYSNNGVTEIYSHPIVKEGDAFIYPMKDGIQRVGSTDCRFEDVEGSGFVYKLANNFGYGIRNFFDLALFSSRPGHLMNVDQITNV